MSCIQSAKNVTLIGNLCGAPVLMQRCSSTVLTGAAYLQLLVHVVSIHGHTGAWVLLPLAGPVPLFRQPKPDSYAAPAVLSAYAACSVLLQQTAGLVQLEAGRVVALQTRSSLCPQAPRHFLLVRQLGTGTFAEVWEAKLLTAVPSAAVAGTAAAAGSSHFGFAKVSCALKVMKRCDNTEHFGTPAWRAAFGWQCDQTKNEYILCNLVQEKSSYPQYIVSAHEWGEISYAHGEKATYILQEYANGGSLLQHLQAASALSKTDCMGMMSQLGPGLLGCHQSGVIHRDLKPGNLLRFIAADGRITYKISDLGEGRWLSGLADSTRGIHGTTPYMAPEMDGLRAITDKVDVWSAGLVYLAARCAPSAASAAIAEHRLSML